MNRSSLRRLLLLAVFALPPLAADESSLPSKSPRGGKVEWARLKTDSPYWNRHAPSDWNVLRHMREVTALNINPEWESASAQTLEELCRYPFIFAENIAVLSETESGHLAEFIRRGGFVLLDACIHTKVNPNWKAWRDAQLHVLTRHFPELRVEALAPTHEIFSVCFALSEFPPQTKSSTDPRWANHSTEPLRGLFVGNRMIGVLSLSGFQCGWAGHNGPRGTRETLKMVANIYIYAMTR